MLPCLLAREGLACLDQRRAGAGAFAQGRFDAVEEVVVVAGAMHEVAELRGLGQVDRHHRFARAEVFVDLDRVGRERQLDHAERQQRHVEGVQVARQLVVGDFAGELDVAEAGKRF